MTEKMEVTEKMCATEEVVDALLECMVEPLLGRSFCKSKEVPTLDQQKSMAKQVTVGFYLLCSFIWYVFIWLIQFDLFLAIEFTE